MKTRVNTNRLIDMVENGLLDTETTLYALLNFLSDDEVGEFAESEDYFYEEEEDEDEDD